MYIVMYICVICPIRYLTTGLRKFQRIFVLVFFEKLLGFINTYKIQHIAILIMLYLLSFKEPALYRD